MRNLNRHFLFWALLLLCTSAQAQTTALANPFEKIDARARACPREATQSIETLAAYLEKGTSSDLEKARSIFIWLTQFISYDDEGYNNDRDHIWTAQDILKRRKALCSGFSDLYAALGKAMKLQIKKIDGYAKGVSFRPGTHFKESNHSWNIIKIAGNWHIFDATWGQGSSVTSNGLLNSKKDFDPFWFDVNPYAAIFSHLPEDSTFALIHPVVDLPKFEKMPDISTKYFEMGFDAADAYRNFGKNNNLKLPECYDFEASLKFVTAPQYAQLSLGKTYTFECVNPKAIKMAVMDAKKKWTYFEPNNGVYKFEYKPVTVGDLRILAWFPNKNNTYSTLLLYQAKTAKP
ncbi:MAG: transglutaminase domain-containing protein [Bacteroidota bacterium]